MATKGTLWQIWRKGKLDCTEQVPSVNCRHRVGRDMVREEAGRGS
jgi:hypothetical protein